MIRSPLLDVHRAQGARVLSPEQGSLLLSYGDVPAEYRAGLEGCALFDETTRGLLAARGPEAQAFLHRILANDVRGLEVGRGNRNLLLTAKGKILEEFDLSHVAAEEFELSTPPGRAGALAAHLDVYLFADRVELCDRTAEYAPIALCGPRAPAVLERLIGSAPDPAPRVRSGHEQGGVTLFVEPVPIAGSPGWRLLAPPSRVPGLWADLVAYGARPAGTVVRDMLRVEAGRARAGIDFGEDVYPQEARLEDAFSLTKGCFVGQEVVAKIDTYGGLNKRLVALRVDHDDPVPAGTRLFHFEEGEWHDVGLVTSWAYSFALETGLALGFVKRKRQGAGTALRLADGPASATIVPLPVRAGALPVTGEFE